MALNSTQARTEIDKIREKHRSEIGAVRLLNNLINVHEVINAEMD